MIATVDHGKLLVSLKRKYARDEFHAVSKVRSGTYAEELVDRIYDALIFYARDLKSEYERYYGDEYDSFEDFLYWKCEVEEDLTSKIISNDSDVSFVAISSDIGLFSIESDDKIATDMLESIFALLGEDIDEDTD